MAIRDQRNGSYVTAPARLPTALEDARGITCAEKRSISSICGLHWSSSRSTPAATGRAERHGFEHKRNGTLSLYAALDAKTGHVDGMTAAHHTNAEFLRFLDRLVVTQPKRRPIHIIVDNLLAYKMKAVTLWLAAHPRVTMHYTPTYSSWLNQIELWFSKIERDMIARGIFTSTGDLRRKLMHYIRLHNKTCTPIQWSYNNPKHRILTISN